MLQIKIQDIQRATLPSSSGNEGWIGVSPSGDAYHIVVHVDVQLARGVMACNRPNDGTPFGGYASWLYFRCAPYEPGPLSELDARNIQVHRTSVELIGWLASHGIAAQIEPFISEKSG